MKKIFSFTGRIIIDKNIFHSFKVKVSFCAARNFYTCVRPLEPSIKGKYGPSNFIVYKFNPVACDENHFGKTTRPIDVRATGLCSKTSVLSNNLRE